VNYNDCRISVCPFMPGTRRLLLAAAATLACLSGPGSAATPASKKRSVVVTRESATAGTPTAKVSPYAAMARQHAQTPAGQAYAPAVPPSVRRTRQPIGRQVQH